MNAARCRSYLARLQTFGIKLGLDNIRTLLSSLGDPQRGYPTILVAGTNGKGSVCSMLAEILRIQGFRTGLYTSPHLVRVEERVRVDGRPVSPAAFRRLVSLLRDRVGILRRSGSLAAPPTYFEFLTALALLHFARRKVDIAVLEVGMGGRFDATNAVDPLLSIITTISRDHEQHLGHDVGRIALEKAGILRPGVPVVCGVRPGRAWRVIRSKARELEAPFREVFDRRNSLIARKKPGGPRFTYSGGGRSFTFSPSLAGRHQGDNAAVALAAADILSRQWRKLSRENMIRGVEQASWPGRLETASRKPLVLLDGAHNEAGARSLAAYIREEVKTPPILVFAVMKDKRIDRITRCLFPLAETVILTRVPSGRSASPRTIRKAAGALPSRVLDVPGVRQACRLALRESAGRKPVIVTGSLFLVGEVKRLRLF